jgi:hypothetical protein
VSVIGIDLYVPPFTAERVRIDAEGGLKLTAVSGSRRGLWPRPQDVPSSTCLPDVLVAVEGPGTAATLLSLGFSAISFPSAAGIGARDAERIARAGWGFVVVLADADDVGRRGARASVLALRTAGLNAKAIDLAPDRSDGSDVADLARGRTDINEARAWLLGELERFTKGTK